ncbi:hypothetical protein A3G55_00765 [Candidatus Giovannonibacteria bacterium RIFCSPLOWO2_12_FULL_44_25]|uniref:Glycosyltransferase 2-like domain-containing protein n=2 Tax=Candidatus Giovannoniibacteriota TaxID=1752738 RepID=A0A1F5WAY0_9BACT|nr:MAG: putative beta-1,4-glucosyltransferase [Parcubacteria group bacterium GW2011_GWC1_44_10]KKT60468.1 MAG: putative beta-1,4-glucosyltransferase [Candidatus Giovannonibacteria bacterium GW2011_GWA1_44_25]KKU30326.1 MAG: putative beta-1,4-glucosyltransferase [Candidatus Giovannonibacteria bacterium GW2011_GWB1_46_20]OGF50530.1 MAG: hypothetical protein A2120_02700 [Candidatus Giovannonibacteria bacterium GWA2_45_15]OGF59663.1 MAG: hypothetical protein A2W40_04595 [Candidatus Giovannonibacter
MNKIPCSIGILTLNSGRTLRRCLDSVKDFAEIVICDGNSTDNTLDVAREYGAKIVKQYDSDEPNLRCVKDKANVRQRNMDAASYDWYFFMDSDDALSRGVIEEIQKITADPTLQFFVYRMPTRLFLDGMEIKHEASYPSYQTRLINRKIKPYFKGKVHDRLVFDEEKYKVGALNSFYDFHWPKERVQNYWKYQKMYANWEADTAGGGPWGGFFYWCVYKRLRIIAGYLYRIPKMYLLYGFKDSMPPRIQLLTLWQHFYIMYLLIKKQILYVRDKRI